MVLIPSSERCVSVRLPGWPSVKRIPPPGEEPVVFSTQMLRGRTVLPAGEGFDFFRGDEPLPFFLADAFVSERGEGRG
jgi:hypothetical protein